jgi:dihydroorotate dehydrogenase electron transfer subunit
MPFALSSPNLPRYETLATVQGHERIIASEFEIALYAPKVAQAARPGQFVEVLFGENYAPLIRRPFSVFRVDREAGTFSILYVARGAFTSGLSRKRVGDTISVLGPLGNPFQWEGRPRPLLIAGGIGAPPILFLAREMRRTGETPQRISVINAARTRDLLVGMGEFEALNVSLCAVTEDGSLGRAGRALDPLLEEAQRGEPFALYACGPMPLLKAVCGVALQWGLPCQVSVETSMPCGIGLCYGCAIPVQDDSAPQGFAYARACREGPVFEARDLIWEG